MKLTLEAARRNVKLTQREAAELLGVSKDTLGNYERGKSFPTVETVKKMENIYHVSYDDLIFLPENYD